MEARYRLSVVPALSASCLTASPSNVNPPHHHCKPRRCFVFATTNPDFATRKRSTQHPVPSTKYGEPSDPTASDARNPEGASAEASTLSGLSNRNQLAPTPASAARRLRNSDPDRSPYRRLALPQTEVWFRGLTQTGPKPDQSARPFRNGSPFPGRTSHDRSSRPEGLLVRCSLARASSEEPGLPFR